MKMSIRHRARRSLLVAMTLSTLLVASGTGRGYAAGPISNAGTGTPDPGNTATPVQPAVGTDLTQLDTPNARFTQLAGGLIGVHLYATRVGINDPSGWRFRNPNLSSVAADGTVSPVDEPFSLHIATTAGAPSVATLSNENSFTLGVAAVTADGSVLPAGSGVISPTAVSFAGGAAPAATDDLSVISTVSGLTLQVGLRQPGTAGQVSVGLNLDQRLALSRRADGSLVAQQALTRYADDGVTPYTAYEPHFVISVPLVEDGAGIAAPSNAANLQFSTNADGKPVLKVTVDPAWLQSSARVYPVHVRVHIDTALSLVYAGVSSSVTTCGTTTISTTATLSTGVQGGCSATTHVYFDTSQIPPNTNIQQATLRVVSTTATTPDSVLAQDESTGLAAPTVPNGATPADQ